MQLRRMLTFAVMLLLGFLVIVGQLIYIQVFQHEDLLSKAQEKTRRTYLRETERGEILDRQGVLLASNQRVRILCANLFIDRYNEPMAKAIAECLGVDEVSLRERLELQYVKVKGREVLDPHVRLKVKVTHEEFSRLQDYIAAYPFDQITIKLHPSEQAFIGKMRRHAVFVEPVDDFKRIYPNGMLAAHTLGYTLSGGAPRRAYRLHDPGCGRYRKNLR